MRRGFVQPALKRAFVSAAAIMCAAVAFGLLVNALRPSGIPLVGDWSARALTELNAGDVEVVNADEAFDLYSRGQALFVDARDSASYGGGHLPGAVNIGPDDVDGRPEEVRALLGNGRVLIAYCHDVDCPLASALARRLRELGARRIVVLPEGWAGWLEGGYPHE
ncbi:MAG TPA: rhodanese-like domain-containing protein [Deltaproteobacteria bacterium]|nr:MAG: Rhodanese-like domain protein [Deltaproteobacteria bacterium ADurb.Bin072]HNS89929.1 rhodanese-like domain-containing protein [Deltaproteobacteria bacterium]HOY74871.1 rhodanese-like domain-containing protein [Deltaproteobacteria bacterium]HPH51196.1 rhodanese-like domain-containing protein [Deltaproteobacteria bacterium]HPO33353.1 rhodanese-like domain-containing protein [Deltaproteobacteria bacterium]